MSLFGTSIGICVPSTHPNTPGKPFDSENFPIIEANSLLKGNLINFDRILHISFIILATAFQLVSHDTPQRSADTLINDPVAKNLKNINKSSSLSK